MSSILNGRKAAIILTLMTATGSATAALEGRSLDGNTATAEAYYDTVLGITWLADANYARTSGLDADGLMPYHELPGLAFNAVIGGYDDWRLPIQHAPSNGVAYTYHAYSYDGVSSDVGWNHTSPSNELTYMFYVNLGNGGSRDGTGSPTACWPNNCLANTGPFLNLMPYWYLVQSTGQPTYPIVGFHDGQLNGIQPHLPEYYGWLVHDGDIGVPAVAVPEPATYALMLAGLVLVARLARRHSAALALAVSAAGAPIAASAAWVGLDDGDYIVTLQCTNSVTLDCSQPLIGSITVSGAGMSAMDLLVGGQTYSGDPVEFSYSDADGASIGSMVTAQPHSFVALRQVTDGEMLGFGAGERFWVYCSPFSTSSCLADTIGTWSARAVATVDEPPALASALLALAALAAARGRRRLSASARPHPAAA